MVMVAEESSLRVVTTDASDRGLGAVLSQEVGRRKLSLREAQNSMIKKECLAIKWATLTLLGSTLGITSWVQLHGAAPRPPDSRPGVHSAAALLTTSVSHRPQATCLCAHLRSALYHTSLQSVTGTISNAGSGHYLP
ncbi:hypothetical protein AAFF_G00218610 [Aldrovandia affinis]|uniref:Reverse transcriptase RNase H-like domain-containing protein n=1 Tax=Aldrovandia affinis TaxID=143900 RepID=A0AAD7SVY7_9TELE|nr:hypothetical protein AAFF_G00218610 [Aldrovandia affinis]